ncbi:hypothetical protein PIB30_037705 [Stylosanthes scabra]|uniref:Uncharacterized protein n=1 Tax=Stylosanthes scabra TaxID=79078 RepID=A0ABU6YCG2_9FABA|nr:hypothetical protein [Stylosanthes scabra]
MASLAEALTRLTSLRSSNNQETPIDECEASTEERSVEKNLEPQVEQKELKCEAQEEEDVEEEKLNDSSQQVEKVECIEVEEVVEELGEIEQGMSFTIEDDSTPTSDIDDLVELSSVELEFNVEEKCAQSPKHTLRNEEIVEEVSKQEVKLEEACQEVEVVEEEQMGVEITLVNLLKTSLSNSPPSITSFSWVKFISLSFIIPLEYGLLETDGQLRALCGFKSKREISSGWQHRSWLTRVETSRFGFKGWHRDQLDESRRNV